MCGLPLGCPRAVVTTPKCAAATMRQSPVRDAGNVCSDQRRLELRRPAPVHGKKQVTR